MEKQTIRGQTMMEVVLYAEGQAVADPRCIPTGTGDIAPRTLTKTITAATPVV